MTNRRPRGLFIIAKESHCVAKIRKRWLDYLVYVAVRLFVCLIQALPEATAWEFSAILGWLVHRLDRRHRLVAVENVRQAMPHFTEQEVAKLVRAVYHHFSLMVVEMILMPRKYHVSNIAQFVRHPNPEDRSIYDRWFQSKRPLIAVTGHFGNWEMLSYILGMAGIRGAIVARRLDNPYLDGFLRRFRIGTGQVILDKNEDYEKIKARLASGRHLGVVGDQDAGRRGLFVDFFGRPASSYKSIALLALEYSAPILILGAVRGQAPLHYDLYLADVILPEQYSHDPAAVRHITERYTRALEWLVRIDPRQYFWLHRRWKHQPRQRKATKAA
jgi:KDO2-lipid IV(A) lauroyltransferase